MFDRLKTAWKSRDFVDGDDQEGFNIGDVDLADVDLPKLEKLAELFAEVEAIKDDDERLTAAKALVAKIGA
jgi:hypothetical protein